MVCVGTLVYGHTDWVQWEQAQKHPNCIRSRGCSQTNSMSQLYRTHRKFCRHLGCLKVFDPVTTPQEHVQSCDTMAITIQVIQTDFDNIQALICVLYNIFLIHPDLSSSVRTTSAVTPGLRSRLIMTFFAARIFKQDDNHLPPTPILDTVITQQRCPS